MTLILSVHKDEILSPFRAKLPSSVFYISAFNVLPEIAKHLSNTSNAIADALRASLGLYMRDKGTEGCGLHLPAWTLEYERMVSSRFDVSRHDFICR